jgi:hypothetical protein
MALSGLVSSSSLSSKGFVSEHDALLGAVFFVPNLVLYMSIYLRAFMANVVSCLDLPIKKPKLCNLEAHLSVGKALRVHVVLDVRLLGDGRCGAARPGSSTLFSSSTSLAYLHHL